MCIGQCRRFSHLESRGVHDLHRGQRGGQGSLGMLGPLYGIVTLFSWSFYWNGGSPEDLLWNTLSGRVSGSKSPEKKPDTSHQSRFLPGCPRLFVAIVVRTAFSPHLPVSMFPPGRSDPCVTLWSSAHDWLQIVKYSGHLRSRRVVALSLLPPLCLTAIWPAAMCPILFHSRLSQIRFRIFSLGHLVSFFALRSFFFFFFKGDCPPPPRDAEFRTGRGSAASGGGGALFVVFQVRLIPDKPFHLPSALAATSAFVVRCSALVPYLPLSPFHESGPKAFISTEKASLSIPSQLRDSPVRLRNSLRFNPEAEIVLEPVGV